MAYSPLDYAGMLGDEARMSGYCNALKRAVKPGDTVLDLGTGTGYFAIFACKLGARHVYAIDPNPAIEVGRNLARANGVADRITWYQEDSTRVELPERVDVIVSDLRGLLPQNTAHLEAIQDARGRLLKPGGILLPMRDRLSVCPVNDEDSFHELLKPWLPVDPAPVDMDSYQSVLANTFISRSTESRALIASPQEWTVIDYRTVTTFKHRQTLTFTIERDAVGHGFNLWFDAEIDDEFGFSFGPDHESHVYGSTFFPWKNPVPLKKGDQVTIDLTTHEGTEGVSWTWITEFQRGDDQVVPKMSQSTLLDFESSSKHLLSHQKPDFRPKLNQEGLATGRAFDLIRDNHSIGEIIETLEREFASSGRKRRDWLKLVSEISLRFA